MNKRRKAFDEMFGCSIDISKDETGEYSHSTTRLCYSFFVVGLDQQQKRIDELEKRIDAKRIKPELGKPFNFNLLNSYKEKIDRLESELKQKIRRIHDLEFYTSQFLYILSEPQESPLSKDFPKVYLHLRQLIDQ